MKLKKFIVIKNMFLLELNEEKKFGVSKTEKICEPLEVYVRSIAQEDSPGQTTTSFPSD